jgi:hypothetical protein
MSKPFMTLIGGADSVTGQAVSPDTMAIVTP